MINKCDYIQKIDRKVVSQSIIDLLDVKEKNKIIKWIQKIDNMYGLSHHRQTDQFAYLEFKFINSLGIGTSVHVKDRLSGEELDATNYDKW